jgi:2-oxoisovalerate dehydrogenase E2 component (dihydrolipoyl transacylase)
MRKNGIISPARLVSAERCLKRWSREMAERVIRLPDVGEGVAEAELVEWHVKVGDLIREDAVLAAVMTDKATVEIPSPVDGEILWLGAEIGDLVAVGSDLVRLRVSGEESIASTDATRRPAPKASIREATPSVPLSERSAEAPVPEVPAAIAARTATGSPTQANPVRHFAGTATRAEAEKPLASPAVRLRAREAGVDLRQVRGSGPAGRITHEDLDAYIARGPGMATVSGPQPKTAVEDIKVIGLRRRIAEKMTIANRIPHITYVEEVDVTELEELRKTLNKNDRHDQLKLTVLPLLMLATVRALAEQPNLNALFDDETGIVHQHAGVHLGIAVQTPHGLVVSVVRHAETLDLWSCAAEVRRLAEAARNGTASRDELTGSTITITSLGAMGGVMSTPIINHPEVAIIGVNKIMVRPAWDGSAFIPRNMMNLSSSFDHRVIDGFDAARFVQRIKTLLETPALIFIES